MLDLSKRTKAFIIAEAGTCHAHPSPRKRLALAMRYVLAAADAGADAVKFQMFKAPVRPERPNTASQGGMFCWIEGDEARSPRWEASSLTLDEWRQVKAYAEACGLVFLASAFQYSTVDWLARLDVRATKVASRAAQSFPWERTKGAALVSLGMCAGVTGLPPDSILIECESVYPSTRRWTATHPGFSDHSGNPWRAVDAISRGCRLVEVHYCLSPLDAGPDLPASLTLQQLETVCEARDAFASFN